MSRLPSVMKHSFSRVPKINIPRSTFDCSHGYKTTFDAGLLVPIYVDEALPGDTFNLRLNAFARLATPIHPIMDNMYLDTFFFAVPVRLLWDNWEKFNGAQEDPGDSTDYTVPTLTTPNSGAGGVAVGSLGDYFGWPVGAGAAGASGYAVNALHTRAYNLIYNQWFRDENLQDSVHVDTDDGPDTYAQYSLKRRGKRHDYFTSALPWPQKADSAVSLPLGTSAPIDYVPSGGVAAQMRKASDDSLATSVAALGTDASGNIEGSGNDLFLDPNDTLVADLSSATAATINALREAEQLQVMYERDARGGTRYTELLRSHFGVVSPDQRLQRAEYLGGGSTPVNIHPVPQTSETNTTNQGNLAAFGTVSTNGGKFNHHGFNKSFVEHCVLIGLASVRADLTYQQGLNRMWSRQTRFDFYWPGLAHLGEQEILNKEIYMQGTTADDDVFGYQERYAEYRYKPSLITGQFRSAAATSLDNWHLSQEFGSLPTLGDSFIQDNPPVDRVIATATEPHFIYDSYIRLICARPMPVYGVPSLGGRL